MIWKKKMKKENDGKVVKGIEWQKKLFCEKEFFIMKIAYLFSICISLTLSLFVPLVLNKKI